MDLGYKEVLKNKVKEAVIYNLKGLFECDIYVLNVSDTFKVKVKFDFKKYNYSKISTFNYNKFAEEIAEDYTRVIDLAYTNIDYNNYSAYKSYCVEQNILKQVKKNIAKDLKTKFEEMIDRANLKLNNNYYKFKLVEGQYMSLYIKKIDNNKVSNLEEYAGLSYNLLTDNTDTIAIYLEWINESAVELDKLKNLESDCLNIFNEIIKNEVERKYKDTLIKAELIFYLDIDLLYQIRLTINGKATNLWYTNINYIMFDLLSTYINYNHDEVLAEVTKYLEKMKTKIIEEIEENI
ncbi:hypothetical protein ABXM50_04060 [Enterococcus faecium]|uniref:hypothetical protein n=1 Tax=Enterococcus faecium TaxID=1352 RepID=UPI00338FC40B